MSFSPSLAYVPTSNVVPSRSKLPFFNKSLLRLVDAEHHSIPPLHNARNVNVIIQCLQDVGLLHNQGIFCDLVMVVLKLHTQLVGFLLHFQQYPPTLSNTAMVYGNAAFVWIELATSISSLTWVFQNWPEFVFAWTSFLHIEYSLFGQVGPTFFHPKAVPPIGKQHH